MPAAAPDYVLVVGGANIDIKARVVGEAIAATSNPGETH